MNQSEPKKEQARSILHKHLDYKKKELKWWFDSFKNPREWNDYSNIKVEKEWNDKMAEITPTDLEPKKKFTEFTPEKVNEMRFSEIIEILEESGNLLEEKKIKLKTKKQKAKMKKVMHEFKAGTLHSGSKKGPIVTDRQQAIAIGLSQASKE